MLVEQTAVEHPAAVDTVEPYPAEHTHPAVAPVSSWQALAERLADHFPSADTDLVVREVVAARDAVSLMALAPAEGFALGELIARNQLLLLTGVFESRQPTD